MYKQLENMEMFFNFEQKYDMLRFIIHWRKEKEEKPQIDLMIAHF